MLLSRFIYRVKFQMPEKNDSSQGCSNLNNDLAFKLLALMGRAMARLLLPARQLLNRSRLRVTEEVVIYLFILSEYTFSNFDDAFTSGEKFCALKSK